MKAAPMGVVKMPGLSSGRVPRGPSRDVAPCTDLEIFQRGDVAGRPGPERYG
ncbi:MAG: hypothetical protein ACJ8EF_02950 [Bradyrhizobium sp.]